MFEWVSPWWGEVDYDAAFAFDDGRRFEGRMRALCPLRGVLSDADGRRWRVVYSGDAWLAADLEPVDKEEVRRAPGAVP